MPKNIESVYISLAQFSAVLNRFQTFEEKGRFVSEMLDALVWNRRGQNDYADFLMGQTEEYRAENRRRQQESRDRRRAEAEAAEEISEIPEPEEPKPAKKPEMKKEAFGTIARKVRLTSEQYINLSGVYGDKLGAAIDILDEYLVNGGKIARNYKDHSLVMKKGGWVYNRVFGLDNRNGGNAKSFRQMDQERAAQICRENFPEVMELYGLNDPEN